MFQNVCCAFVMTNSAPTKIWSKFVAANGGSICNSNTIDKLSHIVVGVPVNTIEELLAVTKKQGIDSIGPTHVIVTSNWIVDCIKTKSLLSPENYLLLTKQQEDTMPSKRSRRDASTVFDAGDLWPKPLPYVMLGSAVVGGVGIGTLSWGVSYPDPKLRPTVSQCELMVHASQGLCPETTACDQRIGCFFDTSDTYYCPTMDGGTKEGIGYLEKLFAKILSTQATDTAASPIIVGTKGGMCRAGPTSSGWRSICSTVKPSADPFERVVRASAARMTAEISSSSSSSSLSPSPAIFLWQVHHCSDQLLPAVMTRLKPFVADLSLASASAAAAVSASGSDSFASSNSSSSSSSSGGGTLCQPLMRHLGLCNVTLEQLRACSALCPVISVQNKFNLWLGKTEMGRQVEIINYCQQHGLVYMPYGTLGGLNARRQEVSLEKDFPLLAEIALRKGEGVSAQLVWLAWLRHVWPCVLHIVGCRSVERVRELRKVYEIRLSIEEVYSIAALKNIPVSH